jgi:aryl-alcohol dehydrogenase-like predicted oxidoreductase
MKYREFGKSGVAVSEIGLGTWQLGGADWGDVDEQTALDVLRAAIDTGVTILDTADVYGQGRSESFIGRFLKSLPPSLLTGGDIFIATKLGRFAEPGGAANFSLQNFRAHTEGSLRRLGVEALDLQQLHCLPTEVMKQGEVFEWLRLLQKEGKIKNFGASVESVEQALLCMEEEGLCALQIIFNIFRQKPIGELFEKAKAKNVALLVRLPVASGLLTGKFTSQTTFAASDHRHYNRDGLHFNVGETFAGLPFEKAVELVEELKPLVPEGLKMADMALRWILDFDAVSTIIPGATSAAQASANPAASDLAPLSPQLHERLKAFYEERVASHIRGAY